MIVDLYKIFQNETIQKANSIVGSKEFVEEQMKLYKEAEEYRHKLELVVTKQESVSKKFMVAKI